MGFVSTPLHQGYVKSEVSVSDLLKTPKHPVTQGHIIDDVIQHIG